MSAAVMSESAQSSDRLDWVRQMRLNFSPTGMCNAEGDIVQDFFKPKTVILQLQEEQRWGDAEREALYQVCGARAGQYWVMSHWVMETLKDPRHTALPTLH